jgi:hypothetical protein
MKRTLVVANPPPELPKVGDECTIAGEPWFVTKVAAVKGALFHVDFPAAKMRKVFP